MRLGLSLFTRVCFYSWQVLFFTICEPLWFCFLHDAFQTYASLCLTLHVCDILSGHLTQFYQINKIPAENQAQNSQCKKISCRWSVLFQVFMRLWCVCMCVYVQVSQTDKVVGKYGATQGVFGCVEVCISAIYLVTLGQHWLDIYAQTLMHAV